MINFAKVPSEYLLRFAHHPDSRPLPPTETSEGERRGLGSSEAAETKWRMNETSGESDAIATDASRVFAGKSTFEIQIFHQKNVDSNPSKMERDQRRSIDGAFAAFPSCSSTTSSKSFQPSLSGPSTHERRHHARCVAKSLDFIFIISPKLFTMRRR